MSEKANTSSKKSLPFFAKMSLRLVGVVCLVWLFSVFDYKAVWKQWVGLSPAVSTVVFLLAVTVPLAKFVRWHLLLLISGQKPGIWLSFDIYVQGLFWGLISPGRVGELIKCYRLNADFGQPYATGVMLVLLDRLFDVFSLGLGLLVGVMLVCRHSEMWFLWLACGFLMVALTVLCRSHLVRALLGLAARLGLSDKYAPIWELVGKCFSRAGLMLTAITLATLGVMVFQGWFLADKGYALGLNSAQMLFIIASLNICSILPLSIFGFGTNEALFLLLVMKFVPSAYNPPKLIAFSLSLSLFNFVPVLVVAGVYMLCSCMKIGLWRRSDSGSNMKADAVKKGSSQ
jgi:glycosyltransferase 2 family protein